MASPRAGGWARPQTGSNAPLILNTITSPGGRTTTISTSKDKQSIPSLGKHSRAPRNPLVSNNGRQGIRNPAGTEKPTAARLRFLDAMKKIEDTYIYSKIEKDQVRLLVIKEGQDEDDINAMIQVVDDDDLGAEGYCYEALSYHWGEGEESHAIIIQDKWDSEPIRDFQAVVFGIMATEGLRANTKRLYVRPNLHSALKRLRAHDRPVALWVDALCIDQNNETEKTQQVMKMNTIYSRAYNVCIWLGSDDPEFHSSRAMAFIKDVIDLRKLDSLLTDDKWIPKWASLFQLLKWSWFSRRWVIQELALAQEASVHCGQSRIHWDDFRDAIGIFHRYFKFLQPRLQDAKLGDSRVTDLEPLGAKLLVDMTSDLFPRRLDGKSESTMGLEKLVSRLATFNTSDPRDTINCLRNICRELNHRDRQSSQAKLPPEPDYTQDLFEVYRDFVKWVIEDSESLDIICRHWALKERKTQYETGPTAAPRLVELPTWILTSEEGSFGFGEAVFRGRKAGDSFVGLPGEAYYSASRRTHPEVQWGKPSVQKAPLSVQSRARAISNPLADRVLHDMSLTVGGYLIGRVDWTSDPIPDGVIPQRGLERLGWNRDDGARGTAAPDQLFRTLVAGRGPHGTPVPTYYSRACLYCLLNETPNGHINTKELLQADDAKYMKHIVQDYLERVRAVTWNRVILQGSPVHGVSGPQSLPTTPMTPDVPKMLSHIVGLGPPRTQARDVIAILFGCSVPVILRPYAGEYKFIGEAYIYGKMDGEVMYEYGDRDKVQFVLR